MINCLYCKSPHVKEMGIVERKDKLFEIKLVNCLSCHKYWKDYTYLESNFGENNESSLVLSESNTCSNNNR